jgi:hypothetical protein
MNVKTNVVPEIFHTKLLHPDADAQAEEGVELKSAVMLCAKAMPDKKKVSSSTKQGR